jgi:hypothetical protein
MKIGAVLIALLGFARAADALDADEYRGGWETYDGGKTLHVLELSIRGSQVRGVYCTDCSDATTLAFVDGTLRADDISFTITHVKDDGSIDHREHADAHVRDGLLLVAGGREGSRPDSFNWTMRKDPRGPAPVRGMVVSKLPRGPSTPADNSVPEAGIAEPRRAPPPYTPPGPWETLVPARLAGVWIGFGAGIDKQYFIIRQVAGGLRGMACGRCDNPYTMAALDDFHVQGDTLTFNILHEDWGPGSLPNHNQVTAHVARNEMRISTLPDNVAPGTSSVPGFKVEASLMGPIAAEATHAGAEER